MFSGLRKRDRLASGLLFQPWNNEFSTFHVVVARPLVTPGPPRDLTIENCETTENFWPGVPLPGRNLLKGAPAPIVYRTS